MSYVVKTGREAAESAFQEGSNFSNTLVSFKSGTTYNVRVPSTEDFAEVYIHSVFKVFFSVPCTKSMGEEDLYCQATSMLYDDARAAKDAGNEKEAEKIRDKAYQLKAKPRYLIGFFNLEDGEPIIVDVSKKQAQTIITAIDKFSNRINTMAFELSKTGTGQNTTVSLMPILDDLTDVEQKNFDATAGKEFPQELFGKVLKVKDVNEQYNDLKAFGFDVNRLDVDINTDDPEVAPINEVDEDPTVNF